MEAFLQGGMKVFSETDIAKADFLATGVMPLRQCWQDFVDWNTASSSSGHWIA